MKLHVKNFGPLTIGTNGFIDISNYTVFIGTQGNGKSTLAKLISVFAWLEKCLIRGDLSIKEVERKNRFRDKFCKFNFYETSLRGFYSLFELQNLSHFQGYCVVLII